MSPLIIWTALLAVLGAPQPEKCTLSPDQVQWVQTAINGWTASAAKSFSWTWSRSRGRC